MIKLCAIGLSISCDVDNLLNLDQNEKLLVVAMCDISAKTTIKDYSK